MLPSYEEGHFAPIDSIDIATPRIYLRIIDRKGDDNPVADHLSYMEGIPHDPVHMNESFPGERLAMVKKIEPWFADYAKFLVGMYMPRDMSYHRRKMSFSDLNYYFWDDTFLYRRRLDDMIRHLCPRS